MALIPDQPLQIAPGYRLQWEQAQNRHVLLYPEGLVELNTSSAEILQYCDGLRDFAAIVAELEQKFNAEGLAPDIETFLNVALNNGWIEHT